jgi:hypothetical protein
MVITRQRKSRPEGGSQLKPDDRGIRRPSMLPLTSDDTRRIAQQSGKRKPGDRSDLN